MCCVVCELVRWVCGICLLVGGVARVLELFVESDVVAAVEAWKGGV